jgi:O-antigen ligase
VNNKDQRTAEPRPARLSAIPVLLGLLCLWATVPYGSAAMWARCAVMIGCAIICLSGLFTACPDLPADSRPLRNRALTIALIWLGLWAVIQLLPFPVRILKLVQPAAKDTYEILFRNSETTTISIDPFLSMSTLAMWSAYALLAWTCARCLTGRAASRTLYLLIVVGTIQAVYGIIAYRSQTPGDLLFPTNRAIGTFASPNSFGGLMAMIVSLTLGALMTTLSRLPEDLNHNADPLRNMNHSARRRMIRLLSLAVAMVIQWVALLLSASRGALVAGLLAVPVMIAWFLVRVRGTRYARIVLALLAVAALIVLMGIGGGYGILASRLKQLATTSDALAISRGQIWLSALRLLFAHPFGIGAGCAPEALVRFEPPLPGTNRLYHAHNDYLELLCELGIVGIIPLFLLLRLLVKRAARLTIENGSASIWLRRGALLGILAALLHSSVEFNLTSRPGVAITFFVLLGITLGYRPTRRNSAGGEPEPAAGQSRVTRALLSVACVLILLHAARLGTASLMMEKGVMSAGGNRDPYLWLPVSKTSPEQGLRSLARATRLVPGYASAHYMRGTGEIVNFERQRDLVIKNNTAGTHRADHEEIISAVCMAMRAEEVAACGKAEEHLVRAAALAPWDPDAHVLIGRCLLARSMLDDSDKTRSEALRHLRVSTLLAPHDLAVLVRACTSLANAIHEIRPADNRKAAMDLLKDLGIRVLRLARASVQTKPVLQAWDRAGVPLKTAFEAEDMPPDRLWQIYDILWRKNDIQNCLACLEVIRKTVSSDTDVERVLRESCRCLLRLGRLRDYRALLNQRWSVFDLSVERQLADLHGKPFSDAVLLIKLRAMERAMSLNAKGRILLCGLEMSRGNLDAASRMVSEIALSDEPGALALLEDFRKSDACPVEEPGMTILAIRSSPGRNMDTNACAILNRMLDSDGLPSTLEHRARLVYAQCLATAGNCSKAEQAVIQAVRECPTDPDALTMLIRQSGPLAPVRDQRGMTIPAADALARALPQYAVGALYLTGSVTLGGYEALYMQSKSISLRLFWRFSRSAPSDLQAVAVIRDIKDNTICSQAKTFAAADPLLFSAGHPVAGCTLVTELNLPLRAMMGRRMVIRLSRKSTGECIPTIEGIDSIEIDTWQDGIRKDIVIFGNKSSGIQISGTRIDPDTFSGLKHRVENALRSVNADYLCGSNGAPAVDLKLVPGDVDANSGFRLSVLGPGGYLIQSAQTSVVVSASHEDYLAFGLARFLREIFSCEWQPGTDNFLSQPSADVMSIKPLWIMGSGPSH